MIVAKLGQDDPNQELTRQAMLAYQQGDMTAYRKALQTKYGPAFAVQAGDPAAYRAAIEAKYGAGAEATGGAWQWVKKRKWWLIGAGAAGLVAWRIIR